ncbi:MAG TPA: carboxypeptidase-like regulatory domain-containing protein [Candidatus Acidoferrales bacterium]|jgi:hypothetical protein|nr:carboxypeptidase-like regulatory domain-containing protein [Candidatus Acidoferrales bacterium]
MTTLNILNKTSFICFAVGLLFPGVPYLTAAEASATADLTGHIAVAGSNAAGAIVLVGIAEPKSGIGPNSYVPNHVQTDRHGDFIIKSLDTRWLYDGYIIASGCRPAKFSRVDPVMGPLNMALERASAAGRPPDTVLQGRILDPNGDPVPGALIHMHEVTRNGTMYFSANDIDPYSVSDDAGNFVVYGKRFTDAGGDVEAPGFAMGLFEDWTPVGARDADSIIGFTTGVSNSWSPGNKPHKLTLVEGASVHGRLVNNGKPVANAKVRLDGCEAASWMWDYTVVTDDHGRFTFSHLPPNGNGRLRGWTGEMVDGGVIPVRAVQIRENGSTTDIGDINLLSALTIDGRIHLSDGKSVPTNSYVYFGDFSIGMSPRSEVGTDGTFRIVGFAAGTLTLYLRIPGYELTPQDHLLISGTVTNITVISDLKNFGITMKPSQTGA